MEYKELQTMTVEQLNKKAFEMKKSLFEMRMKNTVGQLNNPIQVRDTRKTIARILTAMNSQKLATPAAPKAPKAAKTKAKTTKTSKAKKATKKK